MNRLAALVLMVLSFSAQAAETDFYTTFEDAARDAIVEAVLLAPEFEAGGSIYQCGQKFKYDAPTTNKSTDLVWIQVHYYVNCELAGMYHTHPRGDNQFSWNDLRGICNFHIRGVVKAIDGNPRIFDCRKTFENKSMAGDPL